MDTVRAGENTFDQTKDRFLLVDGARDDLNRQTCRVHCRGTGAGRRICSHAGQ